jgi:hypothetical protein
MTDASSVADGLLPASQKITLAVTLSNAASLHDQ